MDDDSDKERAFQWQIGTKILSGDWDDETAKSVKINHDFPLLQEFFNAGWDHATVKAREAPDGSD